MRVRPWYLVAAALPLLACPHARTTMKGSAPNPQTVAEASAVAPSPPDPAPPALPACDIDDDCPARELCVAARCVAITPRLAQCQAASAHFDYRSAALHPIDRAALHREARCLEALPAATVLVAGNCDARGAVESNLLLGLRRAQAVARYLEQEGVPQSRIHEVSYGKELPLCTGSAAACRAANRRADVALGAKAENLTALIRADERREHAGRGAPR